MSKEILPQSFNFEGQVALVTGSGRGLGRMIAETLLSGGAAIALHDVNEEAPAAFGESPSLTALAATLSERGGAKVTSVIGDISKEDDTKAIVKKVEAALGPISILVNCAGGDIAAKGGKPVPNDALGIPIEDVRALLERNLIGTMIVCQAVCLGMAARKKGVVVNIGSAAGPTARFESAIVRSRLQAILGYTNNALTHEQKAQALTEILTHAAAGRCTVERETVPLAYVAEAWERQAAFARRKLILVP